AAARSAICRAAGTCRSEPRPPPAAWCLRQQEHLSPARVFLSLTSRSVALGGSGLPRHYNPLPLGVRVTPSLRRDARGSVLRDVLGQLVHDKQQNAADPRPARAITPRAERLES